MRAAPQAVRPVRRFAACAVQGMLAMTETRAACARLPVEINRTRCDSPTAEVVIKRLAADRLLGAHQRHRPGGEFLHRHRVDGRCAQ